MSTAFSTQPKTSLDQLRSGQSGTIASFDDGSPLMKRFQELGILPGVEVKVLRRAPLGDPLQIQVGGSLLSVRKVEASQIQIQPVAVPAA